MPAGDDHDAAGHDDHCRAHHQLHPCHVCAAFDGDDHDRAAGHLLDQLAAEFDVHVIDVDNRPRRRPDHDHLAAFCHEYLDSGKPARTHDQWGACRGHLAGTVHVTAHQSDDDCSAWDRRTRNEPDVAR